MILTYFVSFRYAEHILRSRTFVKFLRFYIENSDQSYQYVSVVLEKNCCKYFLHISSGSDDLCRLFVSVPDSALSGPTISLLMKVQDNYIPSAYEPEEQDESEIAEQNAFLDAIMNTEVMKLAEAFLHSKSELH